jgi:hypothetical protein
VTHTYTRCNDDDDDRDRVLVMGWWRRCSSGGLNNNRKSNGRSQPTAVTGLPWPSPPPNITRTAHQRLYYRVHYNIFNIILYSELAPTTITTASRKRVIYTLYLLYIGRRLMLARAHTHIYIYICIYKGEYRHIIYATTGPPNVDRGTCNARVV